MLQQQRTISTEEEEVPEIQGKGGSKVLNWGFKLLTTQSLTNRVESSEIQGRQSHVGFGRSTDDGGKKPKLPTE